MKKQFLLLLLFYSAVNFAQQQNSHWYFGQRCHVRFNTDGSTTSFITPDMPMNGFAGNYDTLEGCATVSNSNTGALLFYTDGGRVFNNTHSVMQNGTGLLGSSSSKQNVVIVPSPASLNSPNSYFLFTIDGESIQGLYYSEVDMNANGGLGNVVNKNIPLKDHLGNVLNEQAENISEKITIAKHSNGVDYWVIAQVNNYVYTYLIDCMGVHVNPSTTYSFVNNFPFSADFEYPAFTMKISQTDIVANTTRIATTFTDGIQNSILTGFFNRTDGQITFNNKINGIDASYALEFSPNARFLYFNGNKKIIKYDFNTSQSQAFVNASQLYSIDGSVNAVLSNNFDLQLGPNGSIYVSIPKNNFLGRINNPDMVTSTFTVSAIYIGPLNGAANPPRTSIGLPQLVQKQALVTPITIVANNDVFGAVTTSCVPETTGSVLANDTVNGVLIPSPLSGYVINQIGTTNNNIILNPDGTVTIYPGLAVGTYTISYQICQTGSCPSCSNVGTITIKVSPGLPIGGVDDFKNSNNQTSFETKLISIYPNPSSGIFNIQLNNQDSTDANYKLAVYNALGQFVVEKTINQNNPQIDLTNFENGTYFLKIQIGEETISKIIVKK